MECRRAFCFQSAPIQRLAETRLRHTELQKKIGVVNVGTTDFTNGNYWFTFTIIAIKSPVLLTNFNHKSMSASLFTVEQAIALQSVDIDFIFKILRYDNS
jgi:hypothetical protein